MMGRDMGSEDTAEEQGSRSGGVHAQVMSEATASYTNVTRGPRSSERWRRSGVGRSCVSADQLGAG